jgi:hypothetical protein
VTNGRLVGRYRLPHVNGFPSQARAAERAITRLTDDVNERAVLGAVIQHADGAGMCFLTVERLTRLAGVSAGRYPERTVQRVRARLEDKELLEVYSSLRDPSRYGAHLPRHARQGRGPNWYRLGASIRAAAGYRDVDLSETYGTAPAPPQIASLSPPKSGLPINRICPPIGRIPVTTQPKCLSPPRLQAKNSACAPEPVTPRTENEKPFIEEKRLVPSPGNPQGMDETDNDAFLAALGFGNREGA